MINFLYIKHTWKRFHKILPLSGAAEKTPESPCPPPTLKQYIHLSFPLDRKQPSPPLTWGVNCFPKLDYTIIINFRQINLCLQNSEPRQSYESWELFGSFSRIWASQNMQYLPCRNNMLGWSINVNPAVYGRQK